MPALAGLRALLRDRRGTMPEIPLLILLAAIALSVGIAERSVWRGLVAAAAVLGAIVVLALGLVLFAEGAERFAALRLVRAALESAPARVLGAAAVYAMSAAGWGVVGMFAALPFLDRAAQTPEGRLLFGRGMAAGGALVGLLLCWLVRRRGPRF